MLTVRISERCLLTRKAYDMLHATGKSEKTENYLYAYRLTGDTDNEAVKDVLEDMKVDTDKIKDTYFQEY